MANDQTCSEFSFRGQEYEQLQAALETADGEIQALIQENRQLKLEKSKALAENAHMRQMLAQSYGKLLEAQVAASKSSPRPITGLESELSIVNEELRISLEELQITAEELEETNAALILSNATLEQQVAERTRHLEQALAERDELLRCKEHLLYEIGRRVRDSLQVVMSLIRVQAGRSEDQKVRQALQSIVARVHAVAQVHERLTSGDGSGRVKMDRYLGEICQQIAETHEVAPPQHSVEVEAEAVELSADLAFPLGLIATELIDNALRHAFDRSGTGTVWVQFGHMSDGRLKFVVADDGRGIAKEVQFPKTVGLGMHIVAMMVQRLRAGLSVAHVHGTCFTLTLSEDTTHPIAGDQNR